MWKSIKKRPEAEPISITTSLSNDHFFNFTFSRRYSSTNQDAELDLP